MKIFQTAIFALICIALLFLGGKTIVKSLSQSDKKPQSSISDITSSLSQSSTLVNDSQNTGSSLDIDTEKTQLPQANQVSAGVLSESSVPWGPGKNVDDKNKPTACTALQEKYKGLGSVFIMDSKKVYLSFDLGYEAGFTNNILDTLKNNNVKAMFFLTGNYADKNEEAVNRIIDEGHTIGNHGTAHKNMTTLSNEAAVQEIMGMHNTMVEKYGYTPYLFRFPEGAFSEKALYTVSENAYHSVFWSFAYNDWDTALQPEYNSALEKTVGSLHEGAVYLLHPMQTNSEILDEFIKIAKDKKYEFGVL